MQSSAKCLLTPKYHSVELSKLNAYMSVSVAYLPRAVP